MSIYLPDFIALLHYLSGILHLLLQCLILKHEDALHFVVHLSSMVTILHLHLIGAIILLL